MPFFPMMEYDQRDLHVVVLYHNTWDQSCLDMTPKATTHLWFYITITCIQERKMHRNKH